eukprot:TRINITY_DN3855_c0_g4_i1.p1 TRINITY_DN3855_c0_g4~~TRINITY_DN3855_c0_g4_i1.p1  ORF type:complete len:165 (+),score=29.95 TRINITY_DN3855_c0_g4_i1:30-524(+)
MEVGDYVRITTPSQSVEGLVYAIENQPPLLILQTPSGSQSSFGYQVISREFIESWNKLDNQPGYSLIELLPCDPVAARKRETEEIRLAQKAASKIGRNVTRETQELFNAVSSIYDKTRWDGNSIVVMDDILITPPYTVDDCQLLAKNDYLFKSVRHIVEKYHSG